MDLTEGVALLWFPLFSSEEKAVSLVCRRDGAGLAMTNVEELQIHPRDWTFGFIGNAPVPFRPRALDVRPGKEGTFRFHVYENKLFATNRRKDGMLSFERIDFWKMPLQCERDNLRNLCAWSLARSIPTAAIRSFPFGCHETRAIALGFADWRVKRQNRTCESVVGEKLTVIKPSHRVST